MSCIPPRTCLGFARRREETLHEGRALVDFRLGEGGGDPDLGLPRRMSKPLPTVDLGKRRKQESLYRFPAGFFSSNRVYAYRENVLKEESGLFFPARESRA